jgi:hypothetical protein
MVKLRVRRAVKATQVVLRRTIGHRRGIAVQSIAYLDV